MIITKQQLQQLIDEEFSRALEERRQRKLEETAHKVGDAVRSTVDAQGMKKGQEYTVVDIEHGKWGTVMYGIQPVSGGEQLWIGNGHLLLEPVGPAEEEDDDEDDGSWAYAARVNRLR